MTEANTKALSHLSFLLPNKPTIKRDLQSLDGTTGASLDRQFELSMSNLGINMSFSSALDSSSIEDATGFLGKLFLGGNFGGAVVAAGFFFTGISMLPIFLAGGAVGAAASWIFSKNEEEVLRDLKMEALNKGAEKFLASSNAIFDKISENIDSSFNEQANAFHDAASASISILSNLLEQQENVLKETLAQKASTSKLIQQKNLELVEIEAALNILDKNVFA